MLVIEKIKNDSLASLLFFLNDNCTVGKGYRDVLLMKSFKDPFSQFMLDEILVRKFPDLTDEGKVEGTVSETGDEANKGFGISQKSGGFTRCSFGFVNEHPFYAIRIAIVVY